MMMHGQRVPAVQNVFLIAAALGLRGDDLDAMAGYPGSTLPPDCRAAASLPELAAFGALLRALAPLSHEQIAALAAGA